MIGLGQWKVGTAPPGLFTKPPVGSWTCSISISSSDSLDLEEMALRDGWRLDPCENMQKSLHMSRT